MGNDINSKSSPNQMRIFMKRIREGECLQTQSSVVNETKKDLNMRDMLKITRDINEGVVSLKEEQGQGVNMKSSSDQGTEEEKFRNFFRDMSVNIKFIELEVFDDLVFWGGTIDGVIQFVFKVTPDESTSGVEFNYLEDFSPDNPENEEITGRVESYFDTFYKYWRDNVISTDSAEVHDDSEGGMNPNQEQDLAAAAE